MGNMYFENAPIVIVALGQEEEDANVSGEIDVVIKYN
jgi:hypothetical protein